MYNTARPSYPHPHTPTLYCSVSANHVWTHELNQDNYCEMLRALRAAAKQVNTDNQNEGRDERIDAGQGNHYGVAGAIFTRQLKAIHHTVRVKVQQVSKAGGDNRCTSPASTNLLDPLLAHLCSTVQFVFATRISLSVFVFSLLTAFQSLMIKLSLRNFPSH